MKFRMMLVSIEFYVLHTNSRFIRMLIGLKANSLYTININWIIGPFLYKAYNNTDRHIINSTYHNNYPKKAKKRELT